MSKKRATIIFLLFVVLFFGTIFYRNISTFNSIKRHTGYTFGTIIQHWGDDEGRYVRYQYAVDGITFQGRQGEYYDLSDTVLIVYDVTAPRFSMIAHYNLPIVVNTQSELVELDTALVEYKWVDYLPGDEIHSIKDLWSLD